MPEVRRVSHDRGPYARSAPASSRSVDLLVLAEQSSYRTRVPDETWRVKSGSSHHDGDDWGCYRRRHRLHSLLMATQNVGVRLDPQEIDRVDRLAARLSQRAAGAPLTRAATVRLAVNRGLDAIESELGPDTPPKKGTRATRK